MKTFESRDIDDADAHPGAPAQRREGRHLGARLALLGFTVLIAATGIGSVVAGVLAEDPAQRAAQFGEVLGERARGTADPLSAGEDGAAPRRPASWAGAVRSLLATPERSVVATAVTDAVAVHDTPGPATDATRTLVHPTDTGQPLVFLVRDATDPNWLQVDLPVRPNGSVGWIRADQVRLTSHHYRVEVELSAFELRLFEGGEVVMALPVGIGTADTPTPGGRFYVNELLQPPRPDTLYGSYAFGLSGFSNVLESFAGGEGVIGIHGTNDPSSIGREVSAGCIRLTNADVSALVGVLPLGTPVDILP